MIPDSFYAAIAGRGWRVGPYVTEKVYIYDDEGYVGYFEFDKDGNVVDCTTNAEFRDVCDALELED